MANPAFALHLRHLQPGLNHLKVLAAVVDLPLVNPRGLPVLEHRHMLLAAIAHTSQRLGKMNGGVVVVAHAEQEHLAITIVDPTDRAVQAMWYLKQRMGRYLFSMRATR